MDITQFTGVQGYHDGSIISDYINLIPMENSVIDRVGELLWWEWPGRTYQELRGYYIDSAGKVWLALDRDICIIPDIATNSFTGQTGIKTYNNMFDAGITPIQFIESTSVPSRMYISDTNKLYTVNTDLSNGPWSSPQQPFYNLSSEKPGTNYGKSNTIQLAWFDDRLVLVDNHNNYLWLSMLDIDTHVISPANKLWPNWYVFGDAATEIVEAHAFGGFLYVFYKNCIVRWSRTGVTDDPLSPVTNFITMKGGSNGTILQDKLYLITTDSAGCNSVEFFDQSGNLTKLSTPEIERRFEHQFGHITLINQRQDSFICIFKKGTNGTSWSREGYCVSEKGYWWKWDNTQIHTNPAFTLQGYTVACLWNQYILANNGRIYKLSEDTRRLANDQDIHRALVMPLQLPTNVRHVIQEFAVDMDTGRIPHSPNYVLGRPRLENNDVYLQFSYDRGYTWSRPILRRLGDLGRNLRNIVFRRCGSVANMLCFKFGTSGPAAVQIYKISIKLS